MYRPMPQSWQDLPTRRELHAHLERLDIPADAKVAIAEVIGVTVTVGDRIIEIGRRIVAFALELVRQFPNISFCMLVAMILNALIAGVPLFGPALSALLGPVLLAAGLALGALQEIRDGDLRGRVDLLTREFRSLLG